MNVLDLFSGIGGFSLGLERAGFKTVAFCEIEKFPQKVLKKHWPGVPIYDDVREITNERLISDGIGRIDVITGGFPCQDLSVAGNQKGIEAGRSGLWSELCRIIGDVRCEYAIVENVTALISGDNGRWFGKVLGDLAQIGYDAEWHCIPASELGAHHHRDRVWIIATKNVAHPVNCADHTNSRAQGEEDKIQGEHGQEGCSRVSSGTSSDSEVLADTDLKGLEGWPKRILSERITKQFAWEGSPSPVTEYNGQVEIERDFCGVAYGIYNRTHRLKGLGNAVVPQIPELIGRAIMEHEQSKP